MVAMEVAFSRQLRVHNLRNAVEGNPIRVCRDDSQLHLLAPIVPKCPTARTCEGGCGSVPVVKSVPEPVFRMTTRQIQLTHRHIAVVIACVRNPSHERLRERLRTLEFVGCGLTQAFMGLVQKLVSTDIMPNLECVNVSNNPLGDTGFDNLCRTLRQCARLRAFTAVNVQLSPRNGLSELAGLLSACPTVDEISITSTVEPSFEIQHHPKFMDFVLNAKHSAGQHVNVHRFPVDVHKMKHRPELENRLRRLDFGNIATSDSMDGLIRLLNASVLAESLKCLRIRLPIAITGHDVQLLDALLNVVQNRPDLDLDCIWIRSPPVI
ncbi:unnamed protein product (mitochondrion) [Plasmodiophora brassicae]|uniref:Uncharacterized protein n=1 Tax=Plasmodiophora brassicae TaxID=37360 RepID=A0A3P3YJK9_PLABS|nr:unnamed protein product [Plasmodiophora brassicae]